MTYSEKLKDPRWQKKRLEILERDNFTCRECGSKTDTLHIHHCCYIKGKQPWEYSETLLTLCANCHQERQFAESFLTAACSSCGIQDIVELAFCVSEETGFIAPDKCKRRREEMANA